MTRWCCVSPWVLAAKVGSDFLLQSSGTSQSRRWCCQGPPEKDIDKKRCVPMGIHHVVLSMFLPLPMYAVTFRYLDSKSGFSFRFRQFNSLPTWKKSHFLSLFAVVLIKRGAKSMMISLGQDGRRVQNYSELRLTYSWIINNLQK